MYVPYMKMSCAWLVFFCLVFFLCIHRFWGTLKKEYSAKVIFLLKDLLFLG